MIEQGQLVEVYFNLRKKVFSIKDVKSGLVVGHAPEVALFDCQFKVSEAGRQRVLKEKRKNVHSRVQGKFIPHKVDCLGMRAGYYNPYTTETFIDKDSGEPIHTADLVVLKNKQIEYWTK